MAEVKQSEKERAKEVFSLLEEKKKELSPEEKKLLGLRLNLLVVFLILLILIVVLFVLAIFR